MEEKTSYYTYEKEQTNLLLEMAKKESINLYDRLLAIQNRYIGDYKERERLQALRKQELNNAPKTKKELLENEIIRFFYSQLNDYYKNIYCKAIDLMATRVLFERYGNVRAYRPQSIYNEFEKLCGFVQNLLLLQNMTFDPADYLQGKKYFDMYNERITGGVFWAAALSLENADELNTYISHMLYDNENLLNFSQTLIFGMLASTSVKAQDMVMDLLKTAQTAEGLRQSIVSKIDFAEISVFKRFLQYIVDENLIRFSSVKQSFMYFTGLSMDISDKNLARLPQKIYECLVEDKQQEYLASESAFDFYIALYTMSLDNLDNTLQFINENIRNYPFYKQVVCADFMERCNTYMDARTISDLISMEMEDNLILAIAMLDITVRKLYFNNDNDKLYYLITAAQCLDNAGKKPPKTYHLMDKEITREIYYNRIIEKQIDLADSMQDHYDFGYRHVDKLEYGHGFKNMQVPYVKEKALQLLSSNLGDIRQFAFKKLQADDVVLQAEEYQQIAAYFKSRRNDLRKYLSKLFLQAEPQIVLSCAEKLINDKKKECRHGGLVLLLDNKERLEKLPQYTGVIEQAQVMQKDSVTADYISQIIDKDSKEKKQQLLNFYDEDYEPQIGELSYQQENIDSFIKLDEAAYIDIVKKIISIHESLVGRECQYENYDGTKEWYKFGIDYRCRHICHRKSRDYDKNDYKEYLFYEEFLSLADKINDDILPLYIYYSDVIEDVYNSYNNKTLISRFDYLSTAGYFPEFKKFRQFLQEMDKGQRSTHWESVMAAFDIIRLYKNEHGKNTDKKNNDFYIDLYQYMLLLDEKAAEDKYKSSDIDIMLRYKVVNKENLDSERIKDIFNIVMHAEKMNKAPVNGIELIALQSFIKKDLLKVDYLYKLLMDAEVKKKTGYFQESNSSRLINEISRLIRRQEADKLITEIYDKVIDVMLKVELERTETETEYSAVLHKANIFNGMEIFLKAIYKMADTPFVRGYIWGDNGRKGMFSHIIYYANPNDSDTQEKFAELVKKYKITRKKLLEATMYNLDFIDFTEKCLKFKGLRKAAYYFKAHMNEGLSKTDEVKVHRYTDIDFADLNAGQMDIDWFKESYKELGTKKFAELYDCAKYISSGGNHKRAQYFADAVRGKLKEAEVLARINDKRNQEMVLAYGLLPLRGSNKKKSALKRYERLQLFIKESRQFGAQRRATELSKATIALSNLARTYGYNDVNRFMWAMEIELLSSKEQFFIPKQIDEITVALSLENPAKPEIIVEKNGKQLKNVPAKYKKNAYILELNELKKSLKEQFMRARRSLEDCMINEDILTSEEITALEKHPIIGSMLKLLLFKYEDKIGFIKDDIMYTLTDEVIIPEDAQLTLAHPADLNEVGQWPLWQKKILADGIIQPFKQVFRELYMMTAEEKEQNGYTERFSGYQIEGRKALGILKSRNWIVNDSEGFEKINHKQNLRIDLYSYADWFMPSEIESPSLEKVVFIDNKTGKSKNMQELSPVLFSETMRDLDLVVSVAYVGGIDVQLNHSTLAMRKAVLEYNMQLFKLDNYSIDGHHLMIDGHYGRYNIHLGSGVIHKEGTGMLPVFPVHSQHRGHIFLPFVDEDPKTAELISKVLLLANDKKIKDPEILKFLG